MRDFAHLHLHSNYSLLDGFVDYDRLFEEMKALRMKSVALTDHGVMFGALQFYTKAKRAGIKPIIGCEIYTAPQKREDRHPQKDKSPFHFVLLAENLEGYRNLMEIVSIGFLEGFYYKPRVDFEVLERYNRGLIALTACLGGRLPQYILEDREEEIEPLLDRYRSIFDDGRLYLELQDHGLSEQKKVNEALLDLSRRFQVPLVATNDVHYLKREDAKIHDILLCLQTGKTLSEEKRMRFPNDSFYLKSGDEMEALFSHAPEALENTLKIAERCNVDLSLGEILLPQFPIPENKTEEEHLEDLCREGLKKRYGNITEEIEERLCYELGIIKEMGFSSYFLIVWDFIQYAREKEIAVGPGRGSAAGSLVAYALRITELDPIEHGLIFERFLNPARISMPDIDIDFCYVRRDEVIEFVTSKYGKDKVAQIITFGTMAARGSIRDVGRVLEVPYSEVDRIARLIPEAPKMTLKKALKESADLKDLYDTDETVKKIIDSARQIEGAPRHSSTHAAGVVIAPHRLTHYIPLATSDEEVTTQYPMNDLESIGLLKMDFLGLRNLTVIQDTLIELKRQGIELEIGSLPLDDEKTYQLLQSGQSMGIFQLESKGMQSLLKQLKPDSFPDVVHLLALYRPGPLGSGMVDDFVERRHGRAEVVYPHPDLEEALKETYGVILYQEQVMQISNKMAGYTMAEGDELRRCMGKKKQAEMERHRVKFIEGSVARGFTEEKAEEIFDLMAFFAGYGFNKSHSAAYALLAYQTAYLKAHYKTPYLAALLSSIMDNSSKVALYMDECRKMGIKVLPPDINESGLHFTVVGDHIRFGLKAIKNVGQKAIEEILRAREEEGRFTSLSDFCKKVNKSKVNLKVMESLIRCGAMDSLKIYRSRLLAGLEDVFSRAQGREKEAIPGQLSLLGAGKSSLVVEEELPTTPEFSHQELLQMEKDLVGFYLSGHPLDPYREELEQVVDYWSNDLQDLEGGKKKEIMMGGMLVESKVIRTKRGNKEMAFITLEDWYGAFEVVVFPDLYVEVVSALNGQSPLLVKGALERQDDGSWKMLSEEVYPVEDLEKRGDLSLKLSLVLEEEGSEIVTQIKEIIRKNRGPSPVEIELTLNKSRVIVAAGEDFYVQKKDALVNELESLKDGRVFRSLEWSRRR